MMFDLAWVLGSTQARKMFCLLPLTSQESGDCMQADYLVVLVGYSGGVAVHSSALKRSTQATPMRTS